MNFGELLRALRRGWWMPVLGLLLGGVAAVAVTAGTTPVYTSHTQLFVATTDSTSTAEAFQGNQFAEKRIASYAELLTSQELAARVVAELDLAETPAQLAARVEAAPVSGTVVLDVSVTDPSPGQAQRIARTVADEFIAAVAELETPAGSLTSPVRVTVFGAADLPRSPSAPQPVLDLAVGLVVGLALGAATAVVRARLDRSLKDPDEVTELAGAPVIGVVLRDDELQQRHRVDLQGSSRSAEAYRHLQTNLQFLDVDTPPRVLVVSSAMPSEGKTTVAVNLALALADAGQRVVLIEADLRRPRVTSYLGLVTGVGLTNVLTGRAHVEDVAQPVGEDGGLVVVGAGPTAPNPAQLLASGAMRALLEHLRETHDYVVLDAPPMLPVADATGLAVLADGVLLSVRHGSTTREQLQRTRATLDRVGARTVGTVLNIVPVRDDVSAAYGYSAEYGAAPATAAR
ncbi:capsular exopolysaccharide family [Geodermatophilus telluris]|uniref:non-specific protein-tyrosine kinase n=1 Tax=Geodermatophilus telluris TaxID=1190417 RepID=A0A1G6M1R7_9ACTN|nr:polysaccharide biosynthesis tyrosine autokinase [Geodermatophilus telluris]SDC49483.1 capsular exopolysaccharide family [Geodermatophilus telluris]